MTSKLPIATKGPCKGHPCDNCRICRSGRCCRRDNPDYRLPNLGEWDGPIHGEFGILESDDETVRCHCCGEWFRGLAAHVWWKHDLNAAEYKAIFGLARSYGLVSPMFKDKLREAALHNKAVPANLESGRKRMATLTPEQRSAEAQNARRLQIKKVRKETEVRKTMQLYESIADDFGLTANEVSQIVAAVRERQARGDIGDEKEDTTT